MATTVTKTKENGESTAVPLACVVCRERHLKCDGRQPSCSRCSDSKQNCHYVQSRRGHRPAKKRARPEENAEKENSFHGSSVGSPDDFQQQTQTYFLPPTTNGVSAPMIVADGSAGVSREKLRELYYYYFHDAHPIMIPRAYFPRIPVNSIPPAVEAVMDYVGSQYHVKAKNDPKYLARLQACVYGPEARQDAYTVQALTLLGIVYRAQDQNDAACSTFTAAIDLALHLGMHQARFAQLNNGGDPIIGEMWRRVWWELYVNELLLAAFRHETFSRVTTVEGMDVEMPWEEASYRNCTPQMSRSLQEYDQYTFFDDDEHAFSSFAYRIIAARQIGRLLVLNQPFCPESNEVVNSIDIALNNWMLHLPEQKQTPLGKDGKMDEMMFQAHMMVNAASICLHRPRSDLVFTDVQDSNNCLESRSYGVPSTKFSVHTVKCTTAADKIAELITYPGDSLQHTPLFTCMLTLSAVVHLSAYVLAHDMNARAGIRERLALSVGSLKTIKGQWIIAGSVLGQIKGAAREVMAMSNGIANAKTIERPSSGSSTERTYSTDGSTAVDPWAVTSHDPLFMQIPDLLPPQETIPLSAMPDPAKMQQVMPAMPYA